ncbi:MAG: glutamate-5-semialdehyde dehydrogenase [Clostridia bacterium]
MNLIEMGQKAKKSAQFLLTADTLKNKALEIIANELKKNFQFIIDENKKDIEQAHKNNMSTSMVDRLTLDKKRILAMSDSVLEIVKENDPTSIIIEGKKLYNNLKMEKITVPLGVVGIIYESRPNVTCDCAALCLKSGNAVILRGGKEAINSNKAIAKVICDAIEIAGLPRECVQLIEDTSRETATQLMVLTDYVDVLIPRGGAGLINAVVQNSKVPVIETGVGNCHVYIDEYANAEMAVDIIHNAKCSRPSVCNAAETLLVHKNIAEKVLPMVKEKLSEVKFKACERTMQIIDDCEKAIEEDYENEFLDYILAVKIVDTIDDAIAHIVKYSTGHSEAIITENYQIAEKFINEIDSAAVYVNASTRFTDGGEFGLGAEIGISTQKLHARGPMGLKNLVSYKYVIRGNGQIR